MKLALIAMLVIVTAVAAFNPKIQAAIFKPGEQYVYHYKGQILSGIPKSSKQFSGLFIDSLVLLQFQQDNRVVMKLENIKLSKINQVIRTPPTEILSESELTLLTGEHRTLFLQKLVQPIKFSYSQGEVREVEKESSDPIWSVNIKKGILSLFQVTLKDKSFQTSDSTFLYDPTLSRIRTYGSRSAVSSNQYGRLMNKRNSVFNALETDVTGNCETKYTIITDKSHLSQSSSIMYVSTVRNFENCVTKPFYIQGLFQGVASSPTEKPLVHPVVETDYLISGDANHFLIREATLRGQYQLQVNGLDGVDVSTYIVQKLSLKKTDSIHRPIRLVTPKLDSQGLQMVIPKSSLLDNENPNEYSGRRTGQKMDWSFMARDEYMDDEEENEKLHEERSVDINSAMEMKLEALVQCLYSEKSDKKCTNYLLELVSILREASKQQLQILYRRHYTREADSKTDLQYRKREILLDILPTMTSSASGEVLAELIREKVVGPLRGSLMIKTLALVVKPTPRVIRAILELSKELRTETTATSLTGEAMLRQAAMLAVGTLAHRLHVVDKSCGKPNIKLITFFNSVSMELKRMLEKTTSESEMILITKAMGNMGGNENIMTLKRIIEDRRLSPNVRISAIFGVRRSAKELKKQVIQILMGVFMDVKEVRELRQAAFIVILKANPTYTTLQMIAHSLRHEPSSQVRTLVYSNLINLAFYTSHQPEHKQLVKDARLAIKAVTPISVGAYDSMTIFMNKFQEEYDLGVALDVTKIKSKLSGLPEAIMANLQGTVLGKHRNLLGVGIEGKSLETVLRKIFGPHGLLKDILKGKVTLQDIFKPLVRPDMGSVDHKIREVLNAMMMELRSEDKPFASWYIRLLGNELQYIILNSENIEQIVNKFTEWMTELMVKLSEGVKIDVVKTGTNLASLTLPSPLGVPLHVNLTSIFLLKLEGKVQLKNLPTINNIMSGFFSTNAQIGLDIDLQPVVEVSHFATMSVGMRWLAAGVGSVAHFKTAQPVKVKTAVNLLRHTTSIKYFVPQEITKVAHVKIMPFTFVSYIPSEANRLPFVKEIKELKNDDIVKSYPFKYQYEGTISGLGYQVQGQFSRCMLNSCSMVPMFVTQEVEIMSKPAINVEYVELKIDSLKTNIQFEGVPATLVTDELYEESEDDERVNYRRHSEITPPFDPIKVDELFQREVPIKRELRIVIKPSNGAIPAVQGRISWYMARNLWVNQLNVQFTRAEFQNMPSWKIVIDKVVNPLAWYPEETYRGLRGEYLLKSRFTIDINENDYTIKLKVVPGSPFDFTQELKQHVLLPVDDLPQSVVNKFRYTLEVDFPEVRNYHVMKTLTTVQDAIKHYLYKRITSVIPRESLSKKLILSVELLPEWEKLNLIVKSPRENLYITNVPFYWNPFLPTNAKVKLHNTYSWDHYKPIFSGLPEEYVDSVSYRGTDILRRAECKINYMKQFVNTFDGVAHLLDGSIRSKMLQNGCGVLFAQDCSRQSLFSWYGVAQSRDSFTTVLLLPKAHIELYASPQRRSISVNGEEIKISPTKQYTIPAEAGESVLYVIEKPSEGQLVIKANELGFTVLLNLREHTIYLKLSATSMLEGGLCGLCGNNNKDPSDDLLVPDNHKIPSGRSYLLSNVIPSQTCQVDSLIDSNEHCKKSTQLTIRRYDNEEPMTCRSEREVIQCAKGCRPAQTRSVKTCFRCQSESGQSLTRRTYYQPTSVLQLEDSNVNCEEFSERIELPTTCIPAY